MNYLKKHNYKVLKLSSLVDCLESKQDLPQKAIILTFDDGYVDNYLNVWPILKKYDFPATIFLTVNLIGKKLNNAQKKPLPILGWPQIEKMHKSGLIDFQSHGASHINLDLLAEYQIKSEILESKQIIEHKLKKECNIFAYPRGLFNENIIEILRGIGFKAALTINSGLVDESDDLFQLKRNSINKETSMPEFKNKLN